MTAVYIAEVLQSEPLEMKVMESGEFSRLKPGDYIIHDKESALVQQDDKNDTCLFLQMREETRLPRVQSGLKSMNIEDGKLYEILPGK